MPIYTSINFASDKRPLFNLSEARMPQGPTSRVCQWINLLKKNTKNIHEGKNHVQVDSKEKHHIRAFLCVSL